jgi:hypothetical protein
MRGLISMSGVVTDAATAEKISGWTRGRGKGRSRSPSGMTRKKGKSCGLRFVCPAYAPPSPLSKLHHLPNKRLTRYGKAKIMKTNGLFFKILKINELTIA